MRKGLATFLARLTGDVAFSILTARKDGQLWGYSLMVEC